MLKYHLSSIFIIIIYLCISLYRSKSCPQCREKTNQNKIHRIYFNFSNNDTIVEDTSVLQDKVDKLTFQILLKDKDIKYYSEKNENLEKQNSGLRSEVRKTESEVREKETAIYALKEQIKYFRQQCSEVDVINQEVIRLRKKVENFKKYVSFFLYTLKMFIFIFCKFNEV